MERKIVLFRLKVSIKRLFCNVINLILLFVFDCQLLSVGHSIKYCTEHTVLLKPQVFYGFSVSNFAEAEF